MKLEIKNLSKSFYDKKIEFRALNNISISLDSNYSYGIIGNNGAGKTTFFMCIANKVNYRGKILFDGLYINDYIAKKNKNISFITNKMRLEDDTTLDYNLNFFGILNNLDSNEIKRRKEKIVSNFNLSNWTKKKISTLSSGLKQKALIATSMIGDPDVVLFDEPGSNLDLDSQKTLIEVLKKIKEQGKLILVTSHIPYIIESICDKCIELEAGKIKEEFDVVATKDIKKYDASSQVGK